jgi:hypothetical protein
MERENEINYLKSMVGRARTAKYRLPEKDNEGPTIYIRGKRFAPEHLSALEVRSVLWDAGYRLDWTCLN